MLLRGSASESGRCICNVSPLTGRHTDGSLHQARPGAGAKDAMAESRLGPCPLQSVQPHGEQTSDQGATMLHRRCYQWTKHPTGSVRKEKWQVQGTTARGEGNGCTAEPQRQAVCLTDEGKHLQVKGVQVPRERESMVILRKWEFHCMQERQGGTETRMETMKEGI